MNEHEPKHESVEKQRYIAEAIEDFCNTVQKNETENYWMITYYKEKYADDPDGAVQMWFNKTLKDRLVSRFVKVRMEDFEPAKPTIMDAFETLFGRH